MAIQQVNIGNLVNDGTGDNLRAAFEKVNANFSELDSQLRINGTNVGDGAGQVFKEKVTNQTTGFDELQLRTIKAGANISVVNNTNDITISTPLQNTFGTIVTSNGTVVASQASDTLVFQGSDNVTITRSGNTITFGADLIDTQLNGELDLNTNNITGVGNINITGSISANNFVGSVGGYNINDIATAVFDFDFGNLTNTYSDVIEYLFATGDHDFGTINNPSSITLDLGTI